MMRFTNTEMIIPVPDDRIAKEYGVEFLKNLNYLLELVPFYKNKGDFEVSILDFFREFQLEALMDLETSIKLTEQVSEQNNALKEIQAKLKESRC
ncbi:MAG: hypothetical protein AAF363_18370 [Bacteroidota bacterium]